MKLDEDLYKAFLEEMSSLESFRIAYASDHPHVPLDRDDPDVKRLVEAMAFFSARTRLAAVSNVLAVQRRIFQQFFPYLLSPLPAMGILQAVPSGQFVEPTSFPKGSEVRVSPKPGGSAFFRTLCDLRILPVSLLNLKMLLMPNKGYRLLLKLGAPFPRNDEIGLLPFYINHLNDYQASLKVFHALEEHLIASSVLFDEDANETTRGIPCPASFGLFHADPSEDELTLHPLQEERWFFHFPQQDLFMNFHLPPPSRNWRQFTLCLDLDAKWPANMILNRDIFQLFCVPVINSRRAMAQPIAYDATEDRYPIRYPQPEFGFELHSVLGVYEVKKDYMAPLKAGVISGGSGSYEIHSSTGQNSIKRRWLTVHFPEAFESPRTIVVDALWLQPWYSEAVPLKQEITPYKRTMTGVKWEWLGTVKPHALNFFFDQMDAFIHLFTLTNKPIFNLDDVTDLLRTLGSVHQGEFQSAFYVLGDVRVEQVPQQRTGAGAGMIKHVYYLRFKEFDPSLRPLIDTFTKHIGRVLDIWNSEASVEVRMEAPEEKPT